MKRFSVLCVLILLFVSVETYCMSSRSSILTRIDVGVVLPLSGDVAVYGEKLSRGIELAKEVNASPWKLVTFYEDSKALPLQAVTAFRSLLQQHSVQAFLGFFGSSEILAVAPLANREKIVVISPTASAPTVSEAGPYIFRIASSDVYDARVLATFAARHLMKTSAGIVYVNNDYGLGIRKEFTRFFEQLGGKVLVAEAFAQGANDFRTIIQKVKSKSPEVLLLVGYKEIALFLRQAAELHLDIQILSTGLFEDPKNLEVAGDAANGVYYSMPAYEAGIDHEVLSRFTKLFQNKYKMEPGIGAKLGYDLVNVFLTGVENSQGDLNKLREGLLEIKNFKGVTGTFSFDKNGDVIQTHKIS
jgi:branched-chain amino acid transport system substrate-binding protein